MNLAVPSDAPLAAPSHAQSRFHTYVQIAMILAVITGVEILLIFMPFPVPLLVTALVVTSAIKFSFVIFFFMHLRWEKVFCTILFFIGLVLATGTVWALLSLFNAQNSIPLTFHS